jgi:hypothetical protein
MKMNLLKIALPVLVTGFAAVSAMTPQQSSVKGAVVNEHGFIRLSSATDCQESDMCSPAGTQTCTVGDVAGATRLWKKNASNQCIVPLYRPQ